MKRISPFILLVLLLLPGSLWAQYATDSPPKPIPVDQAFQFSAAARDSQTIIGRWVIAPGYYLYQHRLHFRIVKPKDARLGQPLLPRAIQKTSPDGYKDALYQGKLNIAIPVIQPQGGKIALAVNYQGCAAAGYCYPPTLKVVTIDLSKNYNHFTSGFSVDLPPSDDAATQSSKLQQIQRLLERYNLWLVLVSFLGFGLLIAFTPCVLPMIPILSAIIAGQKKITTAHAFTLSVAYVLGMAMTYAIAGIIVGWVGGSIQVALQRPGLILLFSALFIAMALSLFGFYTIQLPTKWQSTLARINQHQKRGTYLGTFIMGILSTLILSPCVTPPLVGVLSYIGQSGNAALGGLALFIMGIGMGLPLLLIGLAHGKFLPRSGPWMNTVKNVLGILMLATAIWMLQRIISPTLTMLLWSILAIGTAIFMGALSTTKTKWGMLKKGIGLLIFVYGILLLAGAISNNTNPLTPLQFAAQCVKIAQPTPFKSVKTVADIDQQLQIAQQQGKPVLLDFFAEWCISCKQMEQFTFSNPRVQKQLKNFILLRADITNNDAQNKALKHHFNVIAPPTILFFKNRRELSGARIIGEMSAKPFINHLKLIAND